MPYILGNTRPQFDEVINKLDVTGFGEDSVETFLMCISNEYALAHGGNYAAYNKTIGVLLCATLELGRRTGVEPALECERGMFEGSADREMSTFGNIVMTVSQLPLAKMTEGELNYIITRFCHNVILGNVLPRCVEIIENMIVTMSNVINDFYSGVVGPYEDIKIEANGPVSEIG